MGIMEFKTNFLQLALQEAQNLFDLVAKSLELLMDYEASLVWRPIKLYECRIYL